MGIGRIRIAFLCAGVLALPANSFAELLDELVVTSRREPTRFLEHVGNVSALGPAEIDATSHTHIHELLARVAGVWILRGSGQESLPSIRSPVLTGAGSCGAFMTLEDGVPTRPAGFCNVNQLFELPTELATSVEVVRGPGSALYGSNALHGTINVVLPEPHASVAREAAVELGANDFVRLSGISRFGESTPTVIGGVIADDGGFRDDSGYRQIKGFARTAWAMGGGEVTASLSVSDLDQETAGFILGEGAYRDPALNRQNLNPEAFRDASSQRLVVHWSKSTGRFDINIRPYARHSDMEFLQHFLPGQPLEENGQSSFGALADISTEAGIGYIKAGIDLEVADAFLRETQDGPTEGSDFLRETRPAGKHYDFDIHETSAAAWLDWQADLSTTFRLTAGVRTEYTGYEYNNKMLTGNTRDDGTECGFGGCLYTRPADREDSFSDVVPKLGALWQLSDTTSLYINLARGFRAPQITELYRLQSGQLVSDLDSETMDSVELGVRAGGENWQLDSALFSMRKENSVYRDSEGFNVNGGKSSHDGVELSLDVEFSDSWALNVYGTWASHLYRFNVIAARGENFVSGRDVDTAPRWQGGAELRYVGPARLDAAIQWVSLGPYYLDAENRFTYSGHDLLNLRATLVLSDKWSVTARLNNVADKAYADRADFAFGNYRYFPGRGRELFVQLRYLGVVSPR